MNENNGHMFEPYIETECLLAALQALTPLGRDLVEHILEIVIHKYIIDEVVELMLHIDEYDSDAYYTDNEAWYANDEDWYSD